MTIHVNSLGEMALKLAEAEFGMYEHLHGALKRVMVKIEDTAVAEIGRYQDEVGPFPAWPALADSTEASKAAQGYPADAPLEASGEMKESAGHDVEGLEGVMGFTDPTIVFHEFGTSKMPARPVVGPAAFSNKTAIQKLVGAAAVAGFIGGDVIHEALGYELETKD